MNAGKPTCGESIGIGRVHWDVPMRVELRAYLRFSRRIDLQLRRLVVRWTHTASPHARAMSASGVPSDTLHPPIT